MNQNQTFEQYLQTYALDISPWGFLLNLTLTALYAYVLGLAYAKYGNTLSNKKMFASNFEMIAVTTMVIITIVKSSLALSLGLVGALSIVRFRAAIKEPQELSYIFFTIAVGLGFGADQRMITTIGFLFVIGMIAIKYYFKTPDSTKNMNFTILADKSLNISLDTIIQSLLPHCKELELKRLDENKDFMEASFLVEFNNFNDLNEARNALHKIDDSIQINFLDQKGII